MLDLPFLLSESPEQVAFRAWLKPIPAACAPAVPRDESRHEPEFWTVINTLTSGSNAAISMGWTGDMPLVLNGAVSRSLAGLIYVQAHMPARPR